MFAYLNILCLTISNINRKFFKQRPCVAHFQVSFLEGRSSQRQVRSCYTLINGQHLVTLVV